MITYDVAKCFSPDPVARYKTLSEYSGEVFLDTVLKPLMEKGEPFAIDFTDVYGAGSSFLEEAFGGLIRANYTHEQITKLLTILPTSDDIAIEAWEYIKTEWEKKRKNA